MLTHDARALQAWLTANARSPEPSATHLKLDEIVIDRVWVGVKNVVGAFLSNYPALRTLGGSQMRSHQGP